MTVPARDVTVSVVSHGQNALVNQLLEDVQRVCADRVALVVTENIRDRVALSTALPFERIVNERIKGFGANHNAAFQRCRTPYFCVLNPDIRLPADPFPPLLEALAGERVAVAAPLVRNPAGGIEDSARRFPTAASLLKKAFVDRRQPDYPTDRGTQDADWVAGMFMLFRAEAYRAARGFDEAYFMYYEDVDLCRRLRAAGESVRYVPAAEVVHDARRASRREPRLAWHHLASMLRFLSGR
jgi:N-acetylglucosaminyl-diphospho-decaprenol L-rhamnosyltransferase